LFEFRGVTGTPILGSSLLRQLENTQSRARNLLRPFLGLNFNTVLFSRAGILTTHFNVDMTCCHVPSSPLLRYLARLTKPFSTSASAIHIKQQQRCFSRSERCHANDSRSKSSRYARSPRAVQNAKEIGSSWATSKFGHTPNPSQSLRPYADVLTSRWVKRDLQHLGVHSPPGSVGAPQYITSSFVGTWMNGLGPKGIAEWFSNERGSADNDNLSE
jgi:hypothetical protein